MSRLSDLLHRFSEWELRHPNTVAAMVAVPMAILWVVLAVAGWDR